MGEFTLVMIPPEGTKSRLMGPSSSSVRKDVSPASTRSVKTFRADGSQIVHSGSNVPSVCSKAVAKQSVRLPSIRIFNISPSKTWWSVWVETQPDAYDETQTGNAQKEKEKNETKK